MAGTRAHLQEGHGFTSSDFGLFGDTEAEQERYLEGAHGQEHEYNPNVGHQHERPDLFNDRRKEGRRHRPG